MHRRNASMSTQLDRSFDLIQSRRRAFSSFFLRTGQDSSKNASEGSGLELEARSGSRAGSGWAPITHDGSQRSVQLDWLPCERNSCAKKKFLFDALSERINTYTAELEAKKKVLTSLNENPSKASDRGHQTSERFPDEKKDERMTSCMKLPTYWFRKSTPRYRGRKASQFGAQRESSSEEPLQTFTETIAIGQRLSRYP